jgi:ABC-type nitrate/sulfonate/bicarbonate transport system permease component
MAVGEPEHEVLLHGEPWKDRAVLRDDDALGAGALQRNAGNRYDLVIAGMVIIGLIGLLLDGLMRLLEGAKIVRWRYAH